MLKKYLKYSKILFTSLLSMSISWLSFGITVLFLAQMVGHGHFSGPGKLVGSLYLLATGWTPKVHVMLPQPN